MISGGVWHENFRVNTYPERTWLHLHEEGGNHSRYYSPITGKYFSVGRHGSKEVAVGTANRILKDAGIKK